MVTVGIVATIVWLLAGLLNVGQRLIGPWVIFTAVFLATYTAVIFRYSQDFAVAIIYYGVAMVILFVGSIRTYRSSADSHMLWIASGVVIGALAAGLQMLGIGIAPLYFSHNATYHVVQAVSLVCLYRGAQVSMSIQGNN